MSFFLRYDKFITKKKKDEQFIMRHNLFSKALNCKNNRITVQNVAKYNFYFKIYIYESYTCLNISFKRLKIFLEFAVHIKWRGYLLCLGADICYTLKYWN